MDGNKFIDEIGIVWSEDMYDAGHLNYQGSLKYTGWLGEYLSANYPLENHTNDRKYQQWVDTSRRLYHEQVLGNTLKQIKDANAYLGALQSNEGLVIAATLTGKWNKSKEAVSQLMTGLDANWDGESALLTDEGVVVFSSDNTEEDYKKHFDYGSVVFEFSRESGKTAIRSNKSVYEGAKNGFNLVVYDKIAGAVIDSAYFDADNNLERK